LVQKNILSTKGKTKHVATFGDIAYALENIYSQDYHRDPTYAVQTMAFTVHWLYYILVSAQDLLSPPEAKVWDGWKYLRWQVSTRAFIIVAEDYSTY
jgi:hypothetical protein